MENVQIETFGRKLNGTKDVLPGYVIAEVKIMDEKVISASGNDVHPILRYTGRDLDEVEGTIFEITKAELQQADDYEVDEYTRVMVSCKSGNSVWVYVAADD